VPVSRSMYSSRMRSHSISVSSEAGCRSGCRVALLWRSVLCGLRSAGQGRCYAGGDRGGMAVTPRPRPRSNATHS
jgi:hypothetical protein